MLLRLALLAAFATHAFGYAVLTHEAIVDTVWLDYLEPMLKKRFPQATAEELTAAHAYAYGGSIVQDSGFYPFGSHLFTDLVHYVRSGGFITAMLRESRDLNEYAFALGALSHYAADYEGHSIATNRVVPMLYPKLRARFGDTVTYEDSPSAHLKTEFGFDVVQVARGNYATKNYRDFIGFEVSKPVMERAFKATYSIEMEELYLSVDLALGTYRHTIGTLIPEATKIAWELKKDELSKALPSATRAKFVYNLRRSSYEREWGREYERPGFCARVMAWFIRVAPKVGPFRALAFRTPTPQAETLFIKSFNAAVDRYRELLRQSRNPDFTLPDLNFDTGQPISAGKYRMADETYARLLERLAKHDFTGVSPELRAAILRFYEGSNVAAKDPKKAAQLKGYLQRLRDLAN